MTATSQVDSAERVVYAQFRLATAVQSAAGQLAECLESIRALQTGLMSALQEYLGFNISGFDESTLALVQGCASLFEQSDTTLMRALLRNDGLRSLGKTCDQVMQDCNRINGLLLSRDKAVQELRHYEGKLARLHEISANLLYSSERKARNQNKLEQAREVAEGSVQRCKQEVAAFHDRCATHNKSTVQAFLRTYTSLLSDWGDGAKRMTDFDCQDPTSILLGEELVATQVADTEKDSSDDPHISVEESMLEEVCPSIPDVVIEPSFGPCSLGCDAFVSCERLKGEIHEILIDGEPVQIIESQLSKARVRVPPAAGVGARRVEVRTADWFHHVAISDAGFEYFEPISFGVCGHNTKLEVPYGAQPGELPSVASRSTGLLHGLALTAAPLSQIPSPDTLQRYYFEFEVLKVAEKSRGTTRTVSLGFTWPESKGTVALPEQAGQLSRAFVAGGDLPRAYFDGCELMKISGWRPLLEVCQGTVLGAMLEIDDTVLRLTIFQDGKKRCSVEAVQALSWSGEPHGVVDVCGTVQQVALRQRSTFPEIAD